MHNHNKNHAELIELFEAYLTVYRLVAEAENPMSPQERARWHNSARSYLVTNCKDLPR